MIFNLTPQIPPSPLVVIVKKEPPKELSVEDKIAQNYYKCDTLKQWIRQDDATCLDKPAIVESNAPVAGINSSTAVGAVSSSGNLYSYGNCTYYVKNMRPDLPNDLGNADSWYYRYNGPKGSEPAVGAVGVAKGYMHVVYITAVNGDGTVSLSEMNYVGFNVVSSRVAPASEFLYIY